MRLVLDHPNETDVIVVAQGDGRIVDLGNRILRIIAVDTDEVISLPST